MKQAATLTIVLILGLIVWSCTDDGGKGPDVNNAVPPLQFIDSTVPADGDSGVSINSSITVWFTRAMDTASLTGSKFVIDGGLSYSFTRDKNHAWLAPFSTLGNGETYTLTVKSGIKDSLGNVMPDDYVLSFIAGDALYATPKISYQYPAKNDTGVSIDTVIIVKFNKDMDPATINNSSFYLEPATPGTITYADRIATFTPDASLNDNAIYNMTVKNTITDTLGVPLDKDVSWAFKTAYTDSTPLQVVSTIPENTATEVPVDIAIQVTFSHDVDPSSVSDNTFFIEDVDSATYDINGSIVTCTPAQPLILQRDYTVTLTTGLKRPNGTPLSSEYSWTFSTQPHDTIPPQVLSFYPADGATDVSPDDTIIVEFSEELDPATLIWQNFYLIPNDYLYHPPEITYSNRVVRLKNPGRMQPGFTYQAYLSNGITDTAGNHLSGISWSFTISPPDTTITIIPLAVGNKWVFFCRWQSTGNSYDRIDSLYLVSSEVINGDTVFEDTYGNKFWYSDSGLNITYFCNPRFNLAGFIPYSIVYESYNDTLETDLGSIPCFSFSATFSVNCRWVTGTQYWNADIGVIGSHYYEYNYPNSGYYQLQDARLIRYEIVGP